MTTAHSSTSFERSVRREVCAPSACLRLRWSVAPTALGRLGRTPLTLELELRHGGHALLTLDGQPFACERWLGSWNGQCSIHTIKSGAGHGLLLADATQLVVAVFDPGRPERPLHVACDLPAALGLRGGRYELTSGELTEP